MKILKSVFATVSPFRPHIRHLCSSRPLEFEAGLPVPQIFNSLVATFQRENVSDPENSARYILCQALGVGYRYSDFTKSLSTKLSETQSKNIAENVERRLRHEPVQYILGNWEFCGVEFQCQPPVLIPRPETEELVELVAQSCGEKTVEEQEVRVLDVGSGTGVIGISLLSQLPRATCVAIDKNKAAVELSLKNADLLLPQDRRPFYQCHHFSFNDYLNKFGSQSIPQDAQFDIIVSNPPYIPSSRLSCLQAELSYEDREALDGGADGLAVIRQLLCGSRRLLRRGRRAELWMEVDDSHPPLFEKWQREKSEELQGFELVRSLKDYTGKPRFVCLEAT